MKNFWQNKRVLVTGGTGFIGSHVVEKLVARGAAVSLLGRSNKENYLDYLSHRVQMLVGDCTDLHTAMRACENQEVVMNLAAHVGGIEYNQSHQAALLRDNMVIASTMLEAARCANIERFLVVSSACVYPSDAMIPTPESEGFRGEPEPTNGGYGWGKRMAEKLGMYYREQYGMKIGIVRPYNAYGPRDHFDPKTSHVVPALIKRVLDGENPIVVWGSGNQSRALLYVEDLAEGMITAIEKNTQADPINLGTNEEITIKDLVGLIIKIAGTTTQVVFDQSKPDGSPRRNSDNTKAEMLLKFQAKTNLFDGLTKTITWYKKEHNLL